MDFQDSPSIKTPKMLTNLNSINQLTFKQIKNFPLNREITNSKIRQTPRSQNLLTNNRGINNNKIILIPLSLKMLTNLNSIN